MKRGDRLGRWTLVQSLASGGNGEVWKVSGPGGATAALKTLRPDRRSRYRIARFRNEIAFLVDYPNRPGVMPLLDHHLPNEDMPSEMGWIVMPLAIPLRKHLGEEPQAAEVIAAVATVAATLTSLADEGVGHRDVKPDNLFWLDDEVVVGDFGLVTYPEKDPLTEAGRRLGPLDYMAPEMRADADSAAAGPADVWALAKTLWTILTNASHPLPGPHRPDDPAYSLASLLEHPRTSELDWLLASATRLEPAERISMAILASELKALLRPPPEAEADPDLDRLVERVGSLTRGRAQAAAQERELHTRLTTSANRFHRDALVPAAQLLRDSLPGFEVRYREQDLYVLARLPPLQRRLADHAWGYDLSFPLERGPLTVTIALGVRIFRPDAATVVALVRVGSYHPVESVGEDVYFEAVDLMPGRPSETTALETVRVGLAAAAPRAVKVAAQAISTGNA